jgi:hypothetical protein
VTYALGCILGELVKHSKELVEAFTDTEVVLSSSLLELKSAALRALTAVVTALHGQGNAAVEVGCDCPLHRFVDDYDHY